MLFFQSFLFISPPCPVMLVGPQCPAPPCLPGAQADTAGAFLAHQDAPAQPLRMAGSNTILNYRNSLLRSSSPDQHKAEPISVCHHCDWNLLVNSKVWESQLWNLTRQQNRNLTGPHKTSWTSHFAKDCARKGFCVFLWSISLYHCWHSRCHLVPLHLPLPCQDSSEQQSLMSPATKSLWFIPKSDFSCPAPSAPL